MIIVITTKELNPRTHREELIVSHGVDEESGRNVVLPCERPEAIGAVWCETLKEYVLLEKGETC